MYTRLKRCLLGPLINKSQMHGEKLPKKYALPAFASDSISVMGYSPAELMHQFVLAGALFGLVYAVPLALFIGVVIAAVIFLYCEVVTHYPSGGGGYIVVKSNLGAGAGLVAAGALLLDYVLTVSVSIASGLAQLEALAPFLKGHRVLLAACVIVFMTLINLRGYRESGRMFAFPVYAFIGGFSALLATGGILWLLDALPKDATHAAIPSASAVQGVGILLLLRAFASGASALTGIEAISNTVPVFKSPEARNAKSTLIILGCILVTFMIGATALTRAMDVIPHNPETLIPTIAGIVFPAAFPWWIARFCEITLTGALVAILLIAANTAFTGLPVLAANLAKDSFLPRQFRNRGDRQVYSVGIIALSVFAIFPIWIFSGSVSSLIPLYGIGVFLNFTLVGAAMFIHTVGRKQKSYLGMLSSGTAAIVSLVVLGIFMATKFTHGGFAIIFLIPGMVFLMRRIHASYVQHKEGLRLEPGRKFSPRPVANTIIIALGNIDKEALKIVNRAYDISGVKIAVHVEEDEERAQEFRRQWELLGTEIPLEILRPDHNSITAAIADFVRSLRDAEDRKEAHDPSYIHHLYVVIGEVVPDALFANMLHGQTALLLSTALRSMPQVTPIIVRYTPNKPPNGSGMQNDTFAKDRNTVEAAAPHSKE